MTNTLLRYLGKKLEYINVHFKVILIANSVIDEIYNKNTPNIIKKNI